MFLSLVFVRKDIFYSTKKNQNIIQPLLNIFLNGNPKHTLWIQSKVRILHKWCNLIFKKLHRKATLTVRTVSLARRFVAFRVHALQWRPGARGGVARDRASVTRASIARQTHRPCNQEQSLFPKLLFLLFREKIFIA